MKLVRTVVPDQNASSIFAWSKPLIGPQSRPIRPRRHDEVAALQARVAKRRGVGELLLADEP